MILHGNKRTLSLISISCLAVLKAVGENKHQGFSLCSHGNSGIDGNLFQECVWLFFKVTEALSSFSQLEVSSVFILNRTDGITFITYITFVLYYNYTSTIQTFSQTNTVLQWSSRLLKMLTKMPLNQFFKTSTLMLLPLSLCQDDIPSHLSNFKLTHRISLWVARQPWNCQRIIDAMERVLLKLYIIWSLPTYLFYDGTLQDIIKQQHPN